MTQLAQMPVRLPTAEASDDHNHIIGVQRAALNARQNLLFNPCVKRTEPEREDRRSRLPSILYPLHAALECPETHVVSPDRA